MRALPFICAASLAWTSQAALHLEDHFDYFPGTLGSAGSSGGWANSNSGVTVTPDSLDGTALGLAASSGNKVTTTTSSASGTYNEFNSGITSGNVYYSFLLQVNSTTGLDGTGRVLTSLIRNGSQSSYYVDAWLRLSGGNIELGLSKLRAGTTWHSTPLVTGETYLVVVKYEFVPNSNNDIVSLWLNPATGDTEPSADVTFGSGSDGNTGTGIGRCYIYGGQQADLDEVRVGSTWADVTPDSGVVTPPKVPVITGTLLSPAGIVLRGTNGPPNSGYRVLSATDLLTSVNLWSPLSTNLFDSVGNFDSTNPVTGGEPNRFYLLQAGAEFQPPPTGPSIVSNPMGISRMAGETATFTVVAAGTAPLVYRWYFNGFTPVPGGTTATLILTNVQPGQAGDYHVVVTNIAGAATSAPAYLLVVLPPPQGPSITSQPQDQNVALSQTAVFSVTASGTAPLHYQWFFNTNTPLASETNTSLALHNVSTNDEGGYSVVISNSVDSVTSIVATLTVNTNPLPDFNPIGFCNNGGTITGGAAGPVVYVGSESHLQAYADVNPPYTIYITNSFNLSGLSTHIRSDKTVIGLGNVVLSGGGLYLYRATNVIIRNLTLTGASEDGIGIHYSGRIWVDHCTFVDASDGALDITQQSDHLTISWCRFRYTVNSGHNFVNLIAASDADEGDYRITFHHNWWDTGCVERMPSARFARAHMFNNYYNAPGNNYCIRTRIDAECLVENNFFQNVKNPWERYVTSGSPGLLKASGNNVGYPDTSHGVTWSGGGSTVLIPGTDTVFTPPYSYTLDAAGNVPDIVTTHAGVGKGPFAP